MMAGVWPPWTDCSNAGASSQVYQRQLSKEGLQSLVNSTSDAGAVSSNMPVNSMSSEELRNLFSLRASTLSDTYDSVCCRCDLMLYLSAPFHVAFTVVTICASFCALRVHECISAIYGLCARGASYHSFYSVFSPNS